MDGRRHCRAKSVEMYVMCCSDFMHLLVAYILASHELQEVIVCRFETQLRGSSNQTRKPERDIDLRRATSGLVGRGLA